MIELTKDEAKFVQAVRDVVAERGPEFTYPREWYSADGSMCLYVRPDGNGPGCIVGAALAKVGWTLDDLAQHEGGTPRNFLSHVYRANVISAMEAAQTEQDDGKTWGEALAAFNDRLAEGGN